MGSTEAGAQEEEEVTLSTKEELFGVIWMDLVPLALDCADAASAVAKAKAMHARALDAGITLRGLSAVHVPPNSDTIVVLWDASRGLTQ